MGKQQDGNGETKEKKNRASWTTAQLDLLVSVMKDLQFIPLYPGFEGHNYEWTEGIYGEDVEVFPVNNTVRMENNSSQIPTKHMNTLPDPPPMKKAGTSKGNDEDLSASDHLKMIGYLKGQRVDLEIFMTVEHDVVLEILKQVLGHQI
ncbi:hypothetical protein VPH35_077737 [Triticum aestivum]